MRNLDPQALVSDFVRTARKASQAIRRMRGIPRMEGYDTGVRDEAMTAARAVRDASYRCLDCKRLHTEEQSFCRACRRKHDETGTPFWLIDQSEAA